MLCGVLWVSGMCEVGVGSGGGDVSEWVQRGKWGEGSGGSVWWGWGGGVGEVG